jgi:hypothetical protein
VPLTLTLLHHGATKYFQSVAVQDLYTKAPFVDTRKLKLVAKNIEDIL